LTTHTDQGAPHGDDAKSFDFNFVWNDMEWIITKKSLLFKITGIAKYEVSKDLLLCCHKCLWQHDGQVYAVTPGIYFLLLNGSMDLIPTT